MDQSDIKNRREVKECICFIYGAENALSKAFFSYGSGIPKRTPNETHRNYNTGFPF